MADKRKRPTIKASPASDRKQRGRVDRSATFPVATPFSDMPVDYTAWFTDLKARIHRERLRVVLASNAVMVLLYWDIGRSILDKQNDQGWGSRVIDRLAADLREAFPEMKGFSPRNLKYMRAFAAAWPEREIVQQSVAQLSWRQNLALIEKLADSQDRLWYAAKTLEYGWSSNILTLQIEAQAHRRQGKAQTNFPATLPPSDSDMAVQVYNLKTAVGSRKSAQPLDAPREFKNRLITQKVTSQFLNSLCTSIACTAFSRPTAAFRCKDPYLFDFLGTDAPRREAELEQGLVAHIQKFLLELGQGFAFVGRQVHLEIGDEDFYLDLLFYHLKLRRYVVIELKARKFQPGDGAQLGMYMTAVDRLLCHPDDKPTLGLLLVREKNRVLVEYALGGSTKPISVAEWDTPRVNLR